MATQSVNYTVSGTAYWPSLTTPNVKYEPAWKIDVGNLEAGTIKSLKEIGLKLNKKDDPNDTRGTYLSLKRKVMRANGEKRFPPKVVDSQNNPWNGSLIGNGSKVNVKFHVYKNTYGTFAELDSVQVVELVEYVGEQRKEFPDTDGYVVSKSSEYSNASDVL